MNKRSLICHALGLSVALSPSLFAQQQEKIDNEIVNKIKEEGTSRSKVMETISYLTDVSGPRLTGSPETRKAGEWTLKRLGEFGLENAHFESWGPFGRGWTLESYRANMTAPHFMSMIAYPKAWTPSTPTTVRGEPIYLDASTPEELEKYRGKLGRAIVLIAPPREVKALFEAPATRKTDSELLTLANAEGPGRRRPGAGGPGGPQGGRPEGGPAGGNAAPAGAAPGASGAPAGEQPPAEGQRPRAGGGEGRGAMQLQTDKWQLAYEEGAAVVLEPGRGDGGTVFVASATMPRRADPNRDTRSPAEGGNPFSRGPRPWTIESPPILPQLVVAAEHYNRLVRMVQKGTPVQLEIDIESTYHDGDQNSFNIVAEIPGSDLKDEVVMLGAHFDSWHSGTGATDNAIGCGVAIEAMRILKSIGVQPRRTIRVGLWTGEEQGLLGSRAYVSDHFGSAQGGPGGGGQGGGRRATYELKPEHEKFSAYFNLDNGAGKVRGIYLQGNESVRPIFKAWLSPFADMGASTITSSNTGGTDHQSFDGIGLPGFQFIQDPIEYDTRTHHSSMDVFERLQEEDAKQASIIMASFAYHAAMRDEKLPRKTLEGEVVNVPASPLAAPAVPAAQGAAAAAVPSP